MYIFYISIINYMNIDLLLKLEYFLISIYKKIAQSRYMYKL